MQTGDKVTIRRGKLKGEAGEVKFAQGDKVALIMDNGELEVVNRSNIKEPMEATISQGELAAIVNSLEVDHANGHDIAIAELVHAIDSKYPGFATKAGWGARSADAEPGSTGPSYGGGPAEGR